METEDQSDSWSRMQWNIMLIMHIELIGIQIEMLSQCNNKDGTAYVNWCNGVIISSRLFGKRQT